MQAMTKPKPGECRIVTVERQLTAVVKAMVPMAKIPDTQRSSRAKIKAALPSLGVGPVGHSCTLWRPPVDGCLDMELGMIISRPFEPVGEVVPSGIPLKPMPVEVASKVPQVKSHSILVKDDKVLIIDPKDNRVAALIQ